MKRFIKIFSSLELALTLSFLICIMAAIGSFVFMKDPDFFTNIDEKVFFAWLFNEAYKDLSLSFWVYSLVILVALFGLNTLVCTIDKVIDISKGNKPLKAFFPHIVHIGFLIALFGHLLGSVTGFKTTDNLLVEGQKVKVPNYEEIEISLDDILIEKGRYGEMDYLKLDITILENKEIKETGIIEVNNPYHYKGIAFYFEKDGQVPYGIKLEKEDGMIEEVAFDSKVNIKGKDFFLGQIYPDFVRDSKGNVYTRSNNYNNPYLEIFDLDGNREYLSLFREGRAIVLNDEEIIYRGIDVKQYVTLIINKDPGFFFIAFGSGFLVFGMIMLLFFRGSRSELMT